MRLADAQNNNSRLREIISADPLRVRALEQVALLNRPDCWIAAGFVRDAVWDHLHGFAPRPPIGDVDVIWFDHNCPAESTDKQIEIILTRSSPDLDWSVKNQARMHKRNNDERYQSCEDAMRYWPETATAIAIRLNDSGKIEISAPWGLEDLFGLRLTPTQSFSAAKRPIFDERVRAKRWLTRYPLITIS